MVSKNMKRWLNYILTIHAYIYTIAPIVYIFYLCALRGSSLIVWHIVCFTIGCGFLMMAGTLAVSGDAFLSSVASRTWRIRIHWILHLLALVFIVIGMVTVYLWKEDTGRPHNRSNHAKVGWAGIILTIVAGLNGIMTLYPKSYFQCISLGPIRILHYLIGIVATILIFAGQITGYWTHWWQGIDFYRNVSVAAYVIALVLVFLKPSLAAASRIRALFN